MVRMPGSHTCRPQVTAEYTPDEGARSSAPRVTLSGAQGAAEVLEQVIRVLEPIDSRTLPSVMPDILCCSALSSGHP